MTNKGFTAWLKRLGEAWESHNAEAAADLFSTDVCYRENPFDPPLEGREEVERYWLEMLAKQEEVKFSFEVLAVTNERAVVNWRVYYTDISTQEQVTVDGMSVGTFDGEGLCERWLEWWHKEGAMSSEQ